MVRPPCAYKSCMVHPNSMLGEVNLNAYVYIDPIRRLELVIGNDQGVLLLTGVWRIEVSWNVEVSEAATSRQLYLAGFDNLVRLLSYSS